MANYNETGVSGTKWQRCRAVYVENPFSGTKQAHFHESVMVDIGGTTIEQQLHDVLLVPFDGTTSFALLDPETGEPTGETKTHLDLYQLLYSAYIHHAVERDNPPNP